MIDIRDLVTEVAEKIGILSHVDLFIDIRNSQVSEGFQNIINKMRLPGLSTVVMQRMAGLKTPHGFSGPWLF